MSNIKDSRPVHKFLSDSGYKEFTVPDREHQRGFQKSFAVYGGKRFVEVVEFGYYDTPEFSYTISTRFELPDGKWCKVEFHTFGSNEFVERLSLYEDNARDVFKLLRGVGQE